MRIFLLAIITVSLTTAAALAGENPEITVYGKALLSADYAGDKEEDSFYISSNNSRLGFRGHISLREELKAIWQIETRVDLDVSGTEFATRNTFAGFEWKYGTVKVGRHDTPFKLSGNRMDPFLNIYGDYRNIAGLGGGGFNQRADNMLLYESPFHRGLGVKFLYRAEDGSEGTDLVSGSLEYKTHGLHLWAAAESHGRMVTAVNDSTASERSEYGFRLSGRWLLESFEVIGLIEALKDLGGIEGIGKDSWMLGVGWFISESWGIKAKYVGTNGRSDIDGSGAAMFAGGIDFNMGSNAVFYLAGSVTYNEENADYIMTGIGLWKKFETAPGNDPWGISLGTILTF